MSISMIPTITGRMTAQDLRRAFQEGDSTNFRLRRTIIGMSLVGMASMAVVTLFQTGMLRHLPDPPLRRFQSEKVNSSDTAYQYGVPDGTITLAGHATNILLAAIGGDERARERPWIPLVAAGKAGAEAMVASRYLLYEMPVVERAWCGYCIVDALMHIGTFLFTLPEAGKAIRHLS